jgi:hypothetical protein
VEIVAVILDTVSASEENKDVNLQKISQDNRKYLRIPSLTKICLWTQVTVFYNDDDDDNNNNNKVSPAHDHW